MRASDLIETLQQMIDEHGDQEVWLGSDYGDICHTHQALSIEDVRGVTLEDSRYSLSGQAVTEPDEEIDEIQDEIFHLRRIQKTVNDNQQAEIDREIAELQQRLAELGPDEDAETVILITAYRPRN